MCGYITYTIYYTFVFKTSLCIVYTNKSIKLLLCILTQLQRQIAHARKEVIISAGALNSPKLLMLSGVGPRRHLANLRVGPECQRHPQLAWVVA